MVLGHWYTAPHYATALPGCIVGFKIPNRVKIWPEMPLKCSFWGVFWGFRAPRGPRGCSSWSKMVPGHWYTVPHYATALPGCILGFKIPNLVKIWPEMPQRCSFWGVFWGYRAPRGPAAVQVGPRLFQTTGTMSQTMPQPSQVVLWALKSQIW